MPLRSASARLFPLRSRLRAACVVALCVTALGQAPASTAAAPAPRDADLRDQLEQLVHAPGGPPGAIAVLRRDGRADVVRAGVADLATGRRPGPDDHMRIASTAKAFSGAVALSLVDRGALRLDDTLGERLPHLPGAWGTVTLRQLLNHTSGLPDFTEDRRVPEQPRGRPAAPLRLPPPARLRRRPPLTSPRAPSTATPTPTTSPSH